MNDDVHRLAVYKTVLADGTKQIVGINFDPHPEILAIKELDRLWFAAHPAANHRVRRCQPLETDIAPCRWVIVVQRAEGCRVRLPAKGRARPTASEAAEVAILHEAKNQR